MARNRGDKSIAVGTVKHKDKRANIPTEELRGFVTEDEKQPKARRYPRDPSLDPQLVWKGKDEQDSHDLEVPVVPVFIQEKIHPQALIEDFRRTAKEGQPGQADLFADFNGIKFEELIDFYHHEQNWSNRMILGDSLLVMTSLAEKEGLKGKVQMDELARDLQQEAQQPPPLSQEVLEEERRDQRKRQAERVHHAKKCLQAVVRVNEYLLVGYGLRIAEPSRRRRTPLACAPAIARRSWR